MPYLGPVGGPGGGRRPLDRHGRRLEDSLSTSSEENVDPTQCPHLPGPWPEREDGEEPLLARELRVQGRWTDRTDGGYSGRV